MYAIVDIAGQQFKVEKDQKLYVHRLDAKEGSKVSFDKVLLVDDNGKVKVGAPTVDNTVVSAKVVAHVKGDKVLVFKKKRRKGYKKLNGHRQYLTELVIEGIGAGKASATKAAVKAEDKKEEAPKAAAKKPATSAKAATTKAAPKKAAPKKAEEGAEKKAAPKAAAKKADDSEKKAE
jgi:large subunit ribosomal protein L21